MAPDSVDLIDEDDARSVFLALLEQVAYPAGADAHEHLDEVRAGNAEERHASLAGDGAGEQCLTGTGRSHHQDALGNAPAKLLKLLWVLEESDDLFQIILGFIGARDVGERDLVL